MKDEIGKYKRNTYKKVDIATIFARAQAIEIGEILGDRAAKPACKDIRTYYPETGGSGDVFVTVGDLF